MKTTSPFNLIHIHVEKMPTPALADSGASLSLISLKFYQRLLARQDRSKPFKTRAHTKSLYATNNSKMAVKTAVDLSVDIQGLSIPVSFVVISDLSYNVILGADFLRDTRASINFADRKLSLYEGLITVPLSDSGESQTAYTVCNVTIPPRSQAIFQVACNEKKYRKVHSF
jgi:hypothetical protein